MIDVRTPVGLTTVQSPPLLGWGSVVATSDLGCRGGPPRSLHDAWPLPGDHVGPAGHVGHVRQIGRAGRA